MTEFSRDCQRLTLPILASDEPLYKPYGADNWLQTVPREVWRGMSPKKKEEVEIMSAFVHHECELLGINKVLDLGSGLVSFSFIYMIFYVFYIFSYLMATDEFHKVSKYFRD